MDRNTKLFNKLEKTPHEELEYVFEGGIRPDPAEITGWQYDGINTLFRHLASKLPRAIAEKLPKGPKFTKEVIQLPSGAYVGDNVLMEIKSLGTYVRFGHFDVYPAEEDDSFNTHPESMLFNYCCPRNPPQLCLGTPIQAFLAKTKDYVMQPDADNPDVLLGKYYEEEWKDVKGSSAKQFESKTTHFFVLKRAKKLSNLEQSIMIGSYHGGRK